MRSLKNLRKSYVYTNALYKVFEYLTLWLNRDACEMKRTSDVIMIRRCKVVLQKKKIRTQQKAYSRRTNYYKNEQLGSFQLFSLI